MSQVPLWFERKFEFNFPVEQFPSLCARLIGMPARLEDLVGAVSHQSLIAKPESAWSAQEHVGHLLDMEPLWLARVEDFLKDGSTLTPADLTNRRTHEANHNSRRMGDLLHDFRSAKQQFLARVEALPTAEISRTLPGPRLQQPMRLVDHLSFVADHDDHHIARIREMLKSS